MLKIIIMAILLFILVFIPSISLAIEEDPLTDMDLNSLTEETSVDDTAKFLSISGYLESRNQLRAKDVAKPISLRQRLWLDCYLGQDLSAYGSPAQAGWIRVLPALILIMIRQFGIGRMIMMRFTTWS